MFEYGLEKLGTRVTDRICSYSQGDSKSNAVNLGCKLLEILRRRATSLSTGFT